MALRLVCDMSAAARLILELAKADNVTFIEHVFAFVFLCLRFATFGAPRTGDPLSHLLPALPREHEAICFFLAQKKKKSYKAK